ncbi:putative RNA-directed DNA polymerase [Helianthus annuus]|nr:putative RNA-directed DNA polymerase [Helianthus annuus]
MCLAHSFPPTSAHSVPASSAQPVSAPSAQTSAQSGASTPSDSEASSAHFSSSPTKSPSLHSHPSSPSAQSSTSPSASPTAPAPQSSTSILGPPPTSTPNPEDGSSAEPIPTHPMRTRSKNGIYKPKYYANLSLFSGLLHYALLAAHDSRGYKSAAKHSKWVKALKEEIHALQQNNTWVLVPRSQDANIVGSKWIYRTKYKADGSIDRCKADTSLFVYKKGASIVYLLVYVDDIIITGSDPRLIQSFITRLNKEFSVKDLGVLGYFLGLEVAYSDTGVYLSQAKYAHDILARAGLLDSKPVDTPLSTTDIFHSKGDPFHDPTLYRSLVGALQYLTITRPDLSYDVNQVSQHFQFPTVSHFQSVKRILRYVKGTIAFGLCFSKPTTTQFVGYSDAD